MLDSRSEMDRTYLGTTGYELPDVAAYTAIENPTAGTIIGKVVVTENRGRNNRIFVSDGYEHCDIRIGFVGNNNTVVLEQGCRFVHSKANLEGNNGLVIARASRGVSKTTFTLRFDNSTIYYGKNCSANEINTLAHATSVLIGEECLFSWGITMRTHDSHAIIDLDSRKVVNRPKPVIVSPSVWIGQDALIMPGVTVGRGSIVGARSVVTKSIPTRCVAAGVPAKVRRENVTWHRSATPTAEMIDQAITASGHPD